MQYLTVIFSILILNACQSNKSKATKINQTATTQSQPNNLSDIVISFYSKGAGIDYEIANELDALLGGKPNNQIAYSKKGWGREGETDFCIQINKSVSKKEKQQIIDQIKQIANKSKLVHIKEDSECRL